MMSSTSPPEQKARPAPVTTSARTSSSSSSSNSVRPSSSYTSKVSAFSRSGRFSVMVATRVPSSYSYRNDFGLGGMLWILSSASRHDGGGLDLDLGAVLEQGLHLEQAHRRKVLAHHAPVAFADGAQTGKILALVGHEDGQAHQMLRLAARGPHHLDDVQQGALELGREIGADELLVGSPGNLTGDREHAPARRRQHAVRV